MQLLNSLCRTALGDGKISARMLLQEDEQLIGCILHSSYTTPIESCPFLSPCDSCPKVPDFIFFSSPSTVAGIQCSVYWQPIALWFAAALLPTLQVRQEYTHAAGGRTFRQGKGWGCYLKEQFLAQLQKSAAGTNVLLGLQTNGNIPKQQHKALG